MTAEADQLQSHRRVDGRQPVAGSLDELGGVVDSLHDQQPNLVEQSEPTETLDRSKDVLVRLAGHDAMDRVVDALQVDHRPVAHAFGFVFEAEGLRLVLSGDTRPCPTLSAAAQGADVLVHEVFVHRELPVVAGLRTAETVTNVAGYLTLAEQVGKIAADAGVRTWR